MENSGKISQGVERSFAGFHDLQMYGSPDGFILTSLGYSMFAMYIDERINFSGLWSSIPADSNLKFCSNRSLWSTNGILELMRDKNLSKNRLIFLLTNQVFETCLSVSLFEAVLKMKSYL